MMILSILIAVIFITTIVNIGFMILLAKENKERKRIRNEVYNRFIEDLEEMNTFKKYIR